MSTPNYWNKTLQSRLTRRRALIGTAGLSTLAATTLLACSSDKAKTPKAPVDRSGLIYTPSDSTASAKQGGVLKSNVNGDILHMDGLISTSSTVLSAVGFFNYLRLVKWEVAKYPQVADGGIAGDLCESYEISPDKLVITMKLRPNVKWDARPPTNGRVADTDDILWSWKKFVALHPGANAYSYEKEPTAPIESLTAPDNKTIVIKLHEPNAAVLPQLVSQQFAPQPREAESGFNPRNEARGNGPYVLDEYTPSSRLVWRRNPNYYVKDRPFMDRVELPIVSDNAQRLAQFRAGNIQTDVLTTSQQDIVQMKKDVPQTNLLQAPVFSERSNWVVSYGWEGNSPFKDQRVRQAMSMMIDREAYIDVSDNRLGFAKEGLDLAVAYGTVLGAGWTGYWVDPQNEKTFGPNAKYLKFDLPEAKKLISAAGFPSGFEFDAFYARDGLFPILDKTRELYNAWWMDGGLKPRQVALTTQDSTDNYYLGYISKDYAAGTKKGFNGAFFISERPFAAPSLAIYGILHKNGAYYHGMSPDGRNLQDGDPKINDWAEKIRGEFDKDKQKAMANDLVRYFTGQAYYIPQVSQTKAYSLWWPTIRNLGAFVSYPNENQWAESRLNWWIDDTQSSPR